MIKKTRKRNISTGREGEDISMLTEIVTTPEEVMPEELNEEIPVMTLRNMIIFPSVVMPVTVGRQSTLKLVNSAFNNKRSIVIATQRLVEVENPGFKDLYPVAVVGKVLRIFEMSGGNTTVILQANGPKASTKSLQPALSSKEKSASLKKITCSKKMKKPKL